MKETKADGSQERLILTSMILDRTVLAKVAPAWGTTGRLASPWSNLIGGWCVNHFEKFGDAPGKTIESLFATWAAEAKDRSLIDLVESFLVSLSTEYERKNLPSSDYILDIAETYFLEVRLSKHQRDLEAYLDRGELDKASHIAERFSRQSLLTNKWVDVFQDREALLDAFSQQQESILKYPGALGEFWASTLGRDCLVSFMAPRKRGKSFILMDMAYRAALQKRRVAYFVVGDMSRRQVLYRLGSRASAHPRDSGTVYFPKRIFTAGEGANQEANIDFKKLHFPDPLDFKIARKAFKADMRDKIGSREPYLRLSVHPNRGISASGVRGYIQTWAREGFVTDLVVIDYADNLQPPPGVHELRNQINETWVVLSAIRQEFHCLVVSATQSDADSFNAPILKAQHFTNDRRVQDHVTAMIGINQTPGEKRKDIMRLGYIVARDLPFDEDTVVHVAGCRPLGNVCVRSCW